MYTIFFAGGKVGVTNAVVNSSLEMTLLAMDKLVPAHSSQEAILLELVTSLQAVHLWNQQVPSHS